MEGFLRKGELVDAQQMDGKKIKAVNDTTRLEILERLKEKPSYPSEIAQELGTDKQKIYYHMEILEEAGLIEKQREEKKSGGVATFYTISTGGLVYDLDGEGTPVNLGTKENVRDFLKPLMDGSRLDGYIVVGSPDKHGPDQVRARDGHLAGDIALKLGKYCESDGEAVKLDTDVKKEELFDQSLIIIGGVLTNTVTKRFNQSFPVKFEGESFPYRKIQTENSEYSQPDIGVITKSKNPENPEKSIFLVAGVRNKGTKAAVEAFKKLEDITESYNGEDFYCVVKGKDMDGDGEIDSFETVEKS